MRQRSHYRRKMPDLFQDGRKKRCSSREPEICTDDIFREVGILRVENSFLKKKYREIYGQSASL